MTIFSRFVVTIISKEYSTNHTQLFHIHNKQQLLCTSGNFRAICCC